MSELVIKTKLSQGYQTVLPAEVREKLGAIPGDEIIWSIIGEEIYIRVKKRTTKDPIEDLIGKFSTNGKDNATENIDRIVNNDA